MERNKKVANLIKEQAAQFLQKENNRTSLLTVTDCTVSPDLKRATVFITVLPEDKENAALSFAKRRIKELREKIGKSLRTKNIPFLDIQIDRGEKNRQRIDELLQEK